MIKNYEFLSAIISTLYCNGGTNLNVSSA